MCLNNTRTLFPFLQRTFSWQKGVTALALFSINEQRKNEVHVMGIIPTDPTQLPGKAFKHFLWDTWIPVVLFRLLAEGIRWCLHKLARAEDRFEADFGLNEDSVDAFLTTYLRVARETYNNYWKAVAVVFYQLVGALVILAIVSGLLLGVKSAVNHFTVVNPGLTAVQHGIPTPDDKTPGFSPTPSFLPNNVDLSPRQALRIRTETNMVRLVSITAAGNVSYSANLGARFRGEKNGSTFLWAEELQPPNWLKSVTIHGQTVELQLTSNTALREDINAYEPFRFTGTYDPHVYLVEPLGHGSFILLIAVNVSNVLVPYAQASPPVALPPNANLTPQS